MMVVSLICWIWVTATTPTMTSTEDGGVYIFDSMNLDTTTCRTMAVEL